MNLPGFTADASIYRSGRIYRPGSATPTANVSGLLPQLRPVCTKCIWDTFDYGVPTCAKLCRYPAPPGHPQPEEFPVECDPSECPSRNCCPAGCVQC